MYSVLAVLAGVGVFLRILPTTSYRMVLLSSLNGSILEATNMPTYKVLTPNKEKHHAPRMHQTYAYKTT